MMRRLSLVTFLLCAACSAPAPKAVPADAVVSAAHAATLLDDTSWVLTSLGGIEPVPHVIVALDFDGSGGVTGSDGCNRLSGSYSADDGSLRFGPLASTKMACPGVVNTQAAAFTAALDAARTFAVVDNYLDVYGADGAHLLALMRRDLFLPGSRWSVVSIADKNGGLADVLPGSTLDVEFGSNGRITGNAGCNTFVAEYDSEANKIETGLARATRKACASPDGVMIQESRFLDALRAAITFSIEGDRLELYGPHRTPLLILQRQSPA